MVHPPPTPRLLLVEDDPQLAEIITEGFAEDGVTVESAPGARQASRLGRAGAHDLLVVDVQLPEGPQAGFALVRAWRQAGLTTPVLFLTARADVGSRVLGLDAGGDDYLVKPFVFRELRARVRALLRRSGRVAGGSPAALTLPGGWQLDLDARAVRRGAQTADLTPREYALLACLAAAGGQTLSRAAILERVWADQRALEPKLVDVFVSTLRGKLGRAVVETVRGSGYRLGPVGA